MMKELSIYGVILVAAVALQYAVELYLPWKPVFGSWTAVPWAIDILLYGLFGGVAWVTLRSRSAGWRIAMMAPIGVLPHVLPEITHGSDPAYPHIGLLFIVPDLLWIGIGAAVAAFLTRKVATPKSQP